MIDKSIPIDFQFTRSTLKVKLMVVKPFVVCQLLCTYRLQEILGMDVSEACTYYLFIKKTAIACLYIHPFYAQKDTSFLYFSM